MLRFKSGLQKWTLRSDPRRSGLRDPPVPRAVPAEDGGGGFAPCFLRWAAGWKTGGVRSAGGALQWF